MPSRMRFLSSTAGSVYFSASRCQAWISSLYNEKSTTSANSKESLREENAHGMRQALSLSLRAYCRPLRAGLAASALVATSESATSYRTSPLPSSGRL